MPTPAVLAGVTRRSQGEMPERTSGVEPDPGISAALAGLADLDALPVAEHVDRFDAVHAALTRALSSIDRI
ncbi:MAG TPA: hypothetical protein VIL00_02965 [Pseudonocardiaceae bacterium]